MRKSKLKHFKNKNVPNDKKKQKLIKILENITLTADKYGSTLNN